MQDKQIFAIFPTIVASLQYDCGDNIRNYLNNVEMAHNVDEKNKEEYGLVSVDTHILNNPICSSLSEFILQEVKTICQSILCYKIDEFVLTQSWVSHKLPNQYHKKHTHPNSIISGVYYWEDADHIPINFYKDNTSASVNTIDLPVNKDHSKDQPLSWDTFTIKPIKSQLLLFPSYLMHDVNKNLTNQIRKSLAFNVMPKHSLGEREKLTYFMYKG